jgi:hypothetical protein
MTKLKAIIIRISLYSLGAISLCTYGIYLYKYSTVDLKTIIDIVLWPVFTINSILFIDLIINTLKIIKHEKIK